jgi:3-deoxy-manno-octulosonate cytidylyltransferase (CMP-KDO synthetase)
MKILAVIPARINSQRLHKKMLINIKNKPLILNTIENASKSKRVKELVVATDSSEIFDLIKTNGYSAEMTSDTHQSGTSRLVEIYKKYPFHDIYINIQGDQPFVNENQIDEFVDFIEKNYKTNISQIFTIGRVIDTSEKVFSDSCVKIILDKNNKAKYFSRSPIPHVRQADQEEWISEYKFIEHIGIYAYTKNALEEISHIVNTDLENAEKLEQLSWLYHDIPIYVNISTYECISIDTPEDLGKVNAK